ncbi:MAG: DNA replication/repair protein RecF [Caulobacteraceae bacterium]
MSRAALDSLSLTDFRSYARADLRPEGRSVYLFGANGAGKTNLLEAASLLAPGKGLRGVAVGEIGRREPGEATGRAWAVSAVVASDDGETRIGAGLETPTSARRKIRLDGETVAPGRMTDILRLIWLTPAQDRLFLEGAGDRRRFLDRLAYADMPVHAVAAGTYEKAMRERMRLLTEGPRDAVWLDALESQAAEAGARLAEGRATTVLALQAEIDAREDRPFPQAGLTLSGPFEQAAARGDGVEVLAAELQSVLARARDRDASAGRALSGPHRTDLQVIHRMKDRAAAECSTGEQKALVLNLVLAQAARLSRAESAPNPILLLDEVAAHLDRDRRAALFDEIAALKLQAFLTGVEAALFEGLKGRALGVQVDAGELTITDDN